MYASRGPLGDEKYELKISRKSTIKVYETSCTNCKGPSKEVFSFVNLRSIPPEYHFLWAAI